MSKVILLFAILATLASTAHMLNPTSPNDYQQQLPLQNQNPGMPSIQQYQQNGQIPQMEMRPGQDGLLGGLFGSNNNGGLLDAIRNIPQRGMEIMNSFLSNVRNMLPGLGRNGTNNFMGNQQLPYQNQQMMQQQQGQNGLLPNFSNLASPLTDLLQQGRQPNTNSLAQGLTNTLNGLTNGRQPQQPLANSANLNY